MLKYQRIEELVETWINGNHSDVKQAISEMTPFEAALFGFRLCEELSAEPYDSGQRARMLEAWAE